MKEILSQVGKKLWMKHLCRSGAEAGGFSDAS